MNRGASDDGPHVAFPPMTSRTSILFILALSVGLRLLFAFRCSDELFLQIDGQDYRDISSHVAAGDGFSASSYRWFEPSPHPPSDANPALAEANASHSVHPDLHRPPVVPLLGALLYFLPGDWGTWARIGMVLLGAACVWLLFLVARALAGERAARWAAILFALHPYAIFYSGRWSTETPFQAALLTLLVLLVRAKSGGGAVVAGVVLGLATLTRSTAVVLLPMALLWYWIRNRRQFPRVGSALLLGALIALGPWAARNFVHTGVPTPITFVGPYNVWLGTNDSQYAIYKARTPAEHEQALHDLYFKEGKRHIRVLEEAGVTDVVAVNRYWLTQSLEYARREPARMAYILARRALHYFQPAPQSGAANDVLRLCSAVWILLLYGLSASAVLTRALRFRGKAKNIDGGWLLFLPLAGFLTAMPFIFSLRYRFPFFDPILVLVAGAAVPVLFDRVSSRHWR